MVTVRAAARVGGVPRSWGRAGRDEALQRARCAARAVARAGAISHVGRPGKAWRAGGVSPLLRGADSGSATQQGAYAPRSPLSHRFQRPRLAVFATQEAFRLRLARLQVLSVPVERLTDSVRDDA